MPGSRDSPVVLDPWQNIIEVGWSTYDFASLTFSCDYAWYDGSTAFVQDGVATMPQWWDSQTFLSPPLFTAPPSNWFDFTSSATIIPPAIHHGPIAGIVGKWGYKYLTRIEQQIEFGTEVKLRRKTYPKDPNLVRADGTFLPKIEWKGPFEMREDNLLMPEDFGFPKIKNFAPFQFLPPLGVPNDSNLELYIRDIVGQPVLDRDQDIVYLEGTEPTGGPTDEEGTAGQEGVPFIDTFSIEIYFWAYPYEGGGVETRQLAENYQWRVDAPAGQEANWPAPFSPGWSDALAGLIGAPKEMGNELINVGREITVIIPGKEGPTEMRFEQRGLLLQDETVTILFKRIIEQQ